MEEKYFGQHVHVVVTLSHTSPHSHPCMVDIIIQDILLLIEEN